MHARAAGREIGSSARRCLAHFARASEGATAAARVAAARSGSGPAGARAPAAARHRLDPSSARAFTSLAPSPARSFASSADAAERPAEAPSGASGASGASDPSSEPSASDVFGVVRVGGAQYKVCPDDLIFVEKLAGARVNEPIVLDDVLMVGTRSRTIVGRPAVPNASVRAVVEEQLRDAKVLAFKKKRRKGYQRLKGHRQQLTALRISTIDVPGDLL